MENINRRPNLNISVTSSTEQIIDRVRQMTDKVKETIAPLEKKTEKQLRIEAIKKLKKAGIYDKFEVTPDHVAPVLPHGDR